VPGIIEANPLTPGSRSGYIAMTLATGWGFSRPGARSFDVEAFVESLRFAGLDDAFVEQAARRLAADATEGHAWVSAAIRRMQAPLLTCRCGERLLGDAWRGEAQVRCSECGARWHFFSTDDGIERGPAGGPEGSRPPPEPGSRESDPFEEYPAAQVLEEGLPPLPAAIPPGRAFPLARWQRRGSGVVLYLRRLSLGDAGWPLGQYECELVRLRREEGRWAFWGSGGGSWVNALAPPADLLAKYVVIGTTAGVSFADSESGDEELHCWGGLCSPEVDGIEVTDSSGTNRYPIDRQRATFVIGAGSDAEVRVLGPGGQLLSGPDGRRLLFPI
jgi:hypothetical protein